MQSLNDLHTLQEYVLTLQKNQSDELDTYIDILQKSVDRIIERKKVGGSINPLKGLYEPDDYFYRYGTNARGVRERFYNLNFEILREIAQKTGPIASIHQLRAMQIRAASQISYNDDEVGIRVKIKDRKRSPDKKEQKTIEEIEQFILNSGYTDFEGAEERTDRLIEMNEMLNRELLTIDQVAITTRRNRKGKLIDYWLLDGATIKRTIVNKGFEGDKKIKFVQEVESKIIETFTDDEMVFYCSNRRADIKKRNYGYSFIEMCLDLITSWLFGMAYNKEFFNTHSMPKGIISFDNQNQSLDRRDLEELQREWISMFRGIKGMWKTPFLQYGAKYQSIGPNNRDMEYDKYIQQISAWVFSIHGTDPQELGLRLNQARSSFNESHDKQAAFSHDRGLNFQLFNIAEIYNEIIWKNEEWKPFIVAPTGLKARNPLEEVKVDDMQIKSYMTVNQKLKEKDLPPDPYGDIILDSNYIQYRIQMEQMKKQEEMQQQQSQFGGQQENGFGNNEGGGNEPQFEISESDMKKSKDQFVEIII